MGRKISEPPLVDVGPSQRFEYPAIHKHGSPLAGLTESAAVVIGMVTDGRSYLSNDKRAIYSEFSLQIKTVLADKSGAALKPGLRIAAIRQGGAIKLPGGGLLARGCQEKSLPGVNREYLVFLQYLKPQDVFPILNAFELVPGHVYLLDAILQVSVPRDGPNSGFRKQSTLAEYGLPPAEFIDIVSQLLTKPQR